MTSHTLASFDGSQPLYQNESCPFCNIIVNRSTAFIVYEDEDNLAFLDILPLRRGHTLVIPKCHVGQFSKLNAHQAGSLAKAAVNVTRALSLALQDDRLQVITNQIYAQIVPHVHFHIVPAPPLPGESQAKKTIPSSTQQSQNPLSLLRLGHGRQELDKDDAKLLADSILQHASRLSRQPNTKL